jgi:hypothetical protein
MSDQRIDQSWNDGCKAADETLRPRLTALEAERDRLREQRQWLLRFAAQARGWTPEQVEEAMARDQAVSP